jgi:hypothetical protein
MKRSTKLRLIGVAVIVLDLYLMGLFNVAGNANIINTVLLFTFAYFYERKIVKPATEIEKKEKNENVSDE